jgi:hypothetical protein
MEKDAPKSSVILSEASRSRIARGAVEGPALLMTLGPKTFVPH